MDQQRTIHSGAAQTAQERAAAAIRALLDGASAADLACPDPGGYGPWDAAVQEFCTAWGAGGQRAVADLYLERIDRDQSFLILMCAGDRVGDAPCASPGGLGDDVAGDEPTAAGWSMDELLDADGEPVEYIVAGLIPVGVTNAAGRPKIGKSWWTLQLFVAASSGQPFLGFPTPKTKVYYLALEDSRNRLIDRLKKVTAGAEIAPRGSGSRINTECLPVSAGGLAQVRHILECGYKLVIIDTFSRFLGSGDQADQQEMTRVTGALQRLAFEHHAAILLVDHHRKSARTSLDADPIDDILGATAKAGVVDCAIGLYRRHNQNEATLKLSGRDFGDSEIALEWDPDAFRWLRKETGPGRERPEFTLREREAIDAAGDLGHATLKELTDYLGGDRSNLYTRLQGLCRRGALDCVQTARGYEYVLPAAVPLAPVVPVVPVVAVVDGVPGEPPGVETSRLSGCETGQGRLAGDAQQPPQQLQQPQQPQPEERSV